MHRGSRKLAVYIRAFTRLSRKSRESRKPTTTASTGHKIVVAMGSSPTAPLDQVTRFCRQFLQYEYDVELPDGETIREAEVQDILFKRLFAEDTVIPLPPRRYRLRVLKQLIARIEEAIVDWDEHGISDDLTSSLAELISTPPLPEVTELQQRCCITYHLSLLPPSERHADPHITLLESRALIAAGGTTGLRTWEAGLHLGQYLCANPDLVRNKRVLELGTGTGYLAILCAKYLEAQHVIASDGSDDVINHLSDNLFLNGLEGSDKITPMDLKWGHALVGTEEAQWNGGREVDVVIGSDITYDSRVVPALVATLQEIVSVSKGAKKSKKLSIVIGVAERNKASYDEFLKACEKRGFKVRDEPFLLPSRREQNGPFYSDATPFHICQLKYGGN